MAEASHGAGDDIKTKMREALEKKHSREHGQAEGVESDGTEKMHGLDGHVDTQTYRRKAGGGGS